MHCLIIYPTLACGALDLLQYDEFHRVTSFSLMTKRGYFLVQTYKLSKSFCDKRHHALATKLCRRETCSSCPCLWYKHCQRMAGTVAQSSYTSEKYLRFPSMSTISWVLPTPFTLIFCFAFLILMRSIGCTMFMFG